MFEMYELLKKGTKLKNKNIVSTNFNKNRFTNFLFYYD